MNMKKFYFTFLLGAMLATGANAQNVVNGYRLDSTYTVLNSTGYRTFKNVFTYDEANKPLVNYEYDYTDGVTATLATKLVSTYNEKGWLTLDETFESPFDAQSVIERTEYSQHNANGQPTVYVNYEIDEENPGTLVPTMKVVVTKFHGDMLEDADVYGYEDGEWSKMAVMHVDFNSWGGVAKETQTISMYGMEFSTETAFEYDSRHNVTKETSSGAMGNSVTTYENSYDSRDLLKSRVVTVEGSDGTSTDFFFWSKGGSANVNPIDLAKKMQEAVYDLGGRRMQGDVKQGAVKQGVYVVNGKKTFVK